ARRGIVEQQRDAGAGVDAEVVAALRADLEVAVEIPGVDDLLAALALDPESLGYGAARPVHADRLGLLGLAEPGHEGIGCGDAPQRRDLPGAEDREMKSRSREGRRAAFSSGQTSERPSSASRSLGMPSRMQAASYI